MQDNPLKSALIRSAYKAFAKNAFKKVSTNEIVSDANVSKGLLFHYFENKQNLYISLYDMAWKMVRNHVFENFDFSNRDAFERLRFMIIKKSAFLLEHTTIAQFIKRVHLNNDPEITKKRLKIYYHHRNRDYKTIFDNIDTSYFIDPNDAETLCKLASSTFNRITAEWEKNHVNLSIEVALNILQAELTDYVALFKRYFYA